jgi:thioredoxin reductase (NADPH)
MPGIQRSRLAADAARDSDPICWEPGERTINGLNAIVRTEREGSGVTDSVFLVVDHDADDLATFARALTSRYASEYEIRTAATASEAHATLAALSVAGITVALLIVSRDLGDADLLLLLQRARELFPSARRVLSARYLDPSAFDLITGAMRTGRINYFIYKPCEPVVTRLYPVVDDLLGGLRRTKQERGFESIRIIGEQWNPRSHALRDILERSTVPFGFYDSESEEGRRVLAQAGVDGSRLPVLCFYHGAVLVDPTNEQTATALGVRTTPEPGLYDVAIVGAGPAGLAASVYAASEGLRTLLLDPETIGGQAGTSSRIENYLGFPRGISGGELAHRAFEQTQRFGVSIVFTKAATRLRADGMRLIATLSDGAEIESRTVVIATGVAYRRLDVPSVERFAGVGVFYGAAMSEAPTCTGEEVLIVGAGNSAGQAAIHLARFASRVTMVVRGQSLAASMSDYLIRQIGALSNIDVRLGTWVVDGHGDRRLEAVTVERVDGKREKLRAAGLFVLVGGTPHTQWLAGTIEMDAKGYILTGRDLLRSGHPPSGWRLEREPFFLETSMPGVFAVGDARCRSVKRVASAVGEGATAIQLVHEYLRAA